MTFIPPGYSLFQDDLETVENLCDEIWPHLKNGRLLLTGGTGFFGLWLIETLLWANEKRGLNLAIFVLSRNPDAFLRDRGRHLIGRSELELVPGEICSFMPPGGPISHIVHAASENHAGDSLGWASRYLRDSIDGTRHIISLAGERKTQAVLLTSTGGIYQPMEPSADTIARETIENADDYLSPSRVYSESKRMMEMLLVEGAQRLGFRGLIARCFCFSGPHLPLEGNQALASFLRAALNGERIVVNGDGTPLRSYLYASDLTAWLLTILVKGTSGRPYNVGGDTSVSIAELAQKVATAAGRSECVDILKKATPGALPSAYLPDLRRSREELGLVPTIGLEEGIRRSLCWYRQ